MGKKYPAFSGLAERIETGSDQPLFIIDRLNMVNNADDDTTNPMGVSLFANAIDIIRKIDLEYDSYANEFFFRAQAHICGPGIFIKHQRFPGL